MWRHTHLIATHGRHHLRSVLPILWLVFTPVFDVEWLCPRREITKVVDDVGLVCVDLSLERIQRNQEVSCV
jgi:hypothetical protein